MNCRIELNAHTKMSEMNSVISPQELIEAAKEYGMTAIAVTDDNSVQAFPDIARFAQANGIKPIWGAEITHGDFGNCLPYTVSVLAKTKKGLKNLYKIVSALKYDGVCHNVTLDYLEEHRDGLLFGSCGGNGMLYRMLCERCDSETVKKAARFYDYFEIQNHFGTEEEKQINRQIAALGKKLSKPVVAVSDAHYLDKNDAVCIDILKRSSPGDHQNLYLRSTEEMLAEFAYLGEDVAYEVVVENPNRIADGIEPIRPIPRGIYPPHIDGAEESLQKDVWEKAREIYGDVLPDAVRTRLEWEVPRMIRNGYATLFVIAQKLVQDSAEHGYLVGSRGLVGASLVAHLLGITEVDPMPPHYVCPQCRHSEFFTDGSVGSGFDLPEKVCPVCKKTLNRDGQDIPVESFLGLDGDKMPDIDLNFSEEYQPLGFLQSLFGRDHVLRAGTIATLSNKLANGFVKSYAKEQGLTPVESEIDRLAQKCTGVKRAIGQHPGGVMILPEGYDVYDFTPVQTLANGTAVTHFDFQALQDTLLKQDALRHSFLTIYKYLEKFTGIPATDVPMSDPKVYSLFTSPKALGVTPEEIDCETGALALPEFGTDHAQKMLPETKPKSFSDLLQFSGLLHGTNVWEDNAQALIQDGVCTLSDVITTREDMMTYLTRKGLASETAFFIMEMVRKGKASRRLTEEYKNAMRDCGVPEWYVESCQKIRYLFSKAHAAAYTMAAVRLAWYKVYHPVEFYAAYFSSLDSVAIPHDYLCRNLEGIHEYENRLKECGAMSEWCDLRIYKECVARGIQFLPFDPDKSDKTICLPEDGNIRVPEHWAKF